MRKPPFNTIKAQGPHFSRRQFLATSAVAPLLLWLPSRAEAASAIHEFDGPVYINNRLANKQSKIKLGDQIVVSSGGRLVLSMGSDAYLLRENTALEVAGHGSAVASSLRLLTGALL